MRECLLKKPASRHVALHCLYVKVQLPPASRLRRSHDFALERTVCRLFSDTRRVRQRQPALYAVTFANRHTAASVGIGTRHVMLKNQPTPEQFAENQTAHRSVFRCQRHAGVCRPPAGENPATELLASGTNRSWYGGVVVAKPSRSSATNRRWYAVP